MDKINTILFLGDVVPFKSFKFRNTNRIVINLESPISNDGNPIPGKINLNVKKNFLRNIFSTNLICACLGNNHILDYGVKGLNSTIEELKKINVDYFGLVDKNTNNYNSHIIEFNKIKIAFISAVCGTTSPITQLDNVTYLNLLNLSEIEQQIVRIREHVDRIVVYLHWGMEESSYPTSEDIIIARKLIEAGTDIIIGSHAHAPQPIEKYKNGIVAYNLGNFIMPELKNVPSYFDERGVSHSTYNKKLMLWNRISWGLIINMESLEYRIKKYIFISNRVIELPFTPLDKYINLNHDSDNSSYDLLVTRHLNRRMVLRKIREFISRPHIPQKIKKML